MANQANYFGFVPSRHLAGGLIRPQEFQILYSYSTKIHTGDPVKLADDGTIQLAAAGNRVLGIFAGCQYTKSNGEVMFSPYWDAPGATLNSVNAKALVYADPNILFKVRSGGTPSQSSIGNLADHVAGTPSDQTGRSGAYLSGTMAATDAGFRILGIVDAPDNEVGQYAVLEVQIREHELSVDDPSTPGI